MECPPIAWIFQTTPKKCLSIIWIRLHHASLSPLFCLAEVPGYRNRLHHASLSSLACLAEVDGHRGWRPASLSSSVCLAEVPGHRAWCLVCEVQRTGWCYWKLSCRLAVGWGELAVGGSRSDEAKLGVGVKWAWGVELDGLWARTCRLAFCFEMALEVWIRWPRNRDGAFSWRRA